MHTVFHHHFREKYFIGIKGRMQSYDETIDRFFNKYVFILHARERFQASFLYVGVQKLNVRLCLKNTLISSFIGSCV